MVTTITKETKDNLSVTNETKGIPGVIWATGSWGEQGDSIWATHRPVITEESKNNLTVTNETKT